MLLYVPVATHGYSPSISILLVREENMFNQGMKMNIMLDSNL